MIELTSKFQVLHITFTKWAKKIQLGRKLALILMGAAILFGIATYFAVTGSSNPFGPDPSSVIGLVLTDLVLLLALTIVISRRLIKLWLNNRHSVEGSRLQTRIILMFSLVSAIPTIIVALSSVLLFNYGIQSWFNERVTTALEESVAVASAYLEEHKENIRGDALLMANDLNRQAYQLMNNPYYFSDVLESQTAIRVLNEAIVFNHDKEILARGHLSYSLSFELDKLPLDDLSKAERGEVIIYTDKVDRVRALIKLNNFVDTYLLVGRPIDSKVLNHMHHTQGAVNEYSRLKSQMANMQIKFSFVFVIVAFLLLLVAILLGINFAGAISRPISKLVKATERVKTGDLTARVKEGPDNDEIAVLGHAFNLMTVQLEKQHNDLIEANKQIDARRHFSETIISGVSAGIIVINPNKYISMINKSAIMHLSINHKDLIGNHINTVFPEVEDLIDKINTSPDYLTQKELRITRGEKSLTLLVRIAAELFFDDLEGYIITFDDVSELINAQRNAAWFDVARRIAHEIKNPLTPIRLAAERLNKRYSNEVNDVENFTRYTSTISRHAGDIDRIVEEFVNFARMPAPIFAENDICELVSNAVFSRQCISTKIKYHTNLPPSQLIVSCDADQIDRVLTNLLKNSEESIEMKAIDNGEINIEVAQSNQSVIITIIDNGIGIPPQLIDRVTQPYITTKAKGTGLGLAIVKKIISDHNGILQLFNNENNGAMIKIFLPLKFN